MADIVLRDRNGTPVEYPGVERVKLNTVSGDVVEFVNPDLLGAKVATGSFDGTGSDVTITHNLGVIPDCIFIYMVSNVSVGSSVSGMIMMLIGFSSAFSSLYPDNTGQKLVVHDGAYSYAVPFTQPIDTATIAYLVRNANTKTFIAGSSSYRSWKSGYTYRWVAIGGLT